MFDIDVIKLTKDHHRSNFYRAKVMNVDDPMKIGRIQINIYGFTDDFGYSGAFPWCELQFQSQLISFPNVGDIIWIYFDNHDIFRPVYLSTIYSGMKIGPTELEKAIKSKTDDIGEMTEDDVSEDAVVTYDDGQPATVTEPIVEDVEPEKDENVSFVNPMSIHIVTSPFGNRVHPVTGVVKLHNGIDLRTNPGGGPDDGIEVMAMAAGNVFQVEPRGGLGLTVKISHDNGYVTFYGHLHESKVVVGQNVSAGEVIAISGGHKDDDSLLKGSSSGPHLHLSILKDWKFIDPEQVMESGLIITNPSNKNGYSIEPTIETTKSMLDMNDNNPIISDAPNGSFRTIFSKDDLFKVNITGQETSNVNISYDEDKNSFEFEEGNVYGIASYYDPITAGYIQGFRGRPGMYYNWYNPDEGKWLMWHEDDIDDVLSKKNKIILPDDTSDTQYQRYMKWLDNFRESVTIPAGGAIKKAVDSKPYPWDSLYMPSNFYWNPEMHHPTSAEIEDVISGPPNPIAKLKIDGREYFKQTTLRSFTGISALELDDNNGFERVRLDYNHGDGYLEFSNKGWQGLDVFTKGVFKLQAHGKKEDETDMNSHRLDFAGDRGAEFAAGDGPALFRGAKKVTIQSFFKDVAIRGRGGIELASDNTWIGSFANYKIVKGFGVGTGDAGVDASINDAYMEGAPILTNGMGKDTPDGAGAVLGLESADGISGLLEDTISINEMFKAISKFTKMLQSLVVGNPTSEPGYNAFYTKVNAMKNDLDKIIEGADIMTEKLGHLPITTAGTCTMEASQLAGSL